MALQKVSLRDPRRERIVTPAATQVPGPSGHPHVVMPEEADLEPETQDQFVKPRRITRPPRAPAVALEHHAGRRVMGGQHIDATGGEKGLDVLPGVVALGVPLQAPRPALVVRGAMASAHAPPP